MGLPVRTVLVVVLQVVVWQWVLTSGRVWGQGSSPETTPYRGGGQPSRWATTGSRTPQTTPRPQATAVQGRYAAQAQARPGATPSKPSAPGLMPETAREPLTRSPKPLAEATRSAETAGGSGGSSPSVADALKLVPTQKEIDFAIPSPQEAAECKISVQKVAGAVGWVVEDSQGATLRRFLDTNGDGKVDQWCYYKDGLEIYRDIDSDFNGKVDQCRWYNMAGTRWGIDRDEDGRIDSWRIISPEEVSREVVAALAKQDVERFMRVMITPEEVRSLGLGQAKSSELMEKIQNAASRFQAAAGQQKLVTPETKWAQFSGTHPGIVPAGTDGSTRDVEVYENVMAIVRSGANHGQVQIGTLVKVGEGWRVIEVPQPASDGPNDHAAVGMFFRSPAANRPAVAAGGPSEKAQAILTELEELDAAVNRTADAAEQARLNAKRADLLEQLAGEAGKPEDRAAWIRQLADMVSAAVQSGTYPDGATRLESLFQRLSKSEADRTLAAYVKFRQLTAEYGLAVHAKGVDFAKVQTEWLKKLEQYVADYPQSPDAAEAMLQLAIAQEFAGQEEEAKRWYGQIVRDFRDAPVARKAAGAKNRLESVGKPIELSGKGLNGEQVELARYRGKVVLIQYWATWCEPCKADMIIIRDLLDKLGGEVFGVIGVNLDTDAQAVSAFLAENKLPWPQIHEEGGLDSRPAVELGILTLPTMILVDREGKVANRNVSASELATELKRLTK